MALISKRFVPCYLTSFYFISFHFIISFFYLIHFISFHFIFFPHIVFFLFFPYFSFIPFLSIFFHSVFSPLLLSISLHRCHSILLNFHRSHLIQRDSTYPPAVLSKLPTPLQCLLTFPFLLFFLLLLSILFF